MVTVAELEGEVNTAAKSSLYTVAPPTGHTTQYNTGQIHIDFKDLPAKSMINPDWGCWLRTR